jgi:hypothetical protein
MCSEELKNSLWGVEEAIEGSSTKKPKRVKHERSTTSTSTSARNKKDSTKEALQDKINHFAEVGRPSPFVHSHSPC